MFLIRVMLLVLSLGSAVAVAASDPTRPPVFGGGGIKKVYPPLELRMILSDPANMRAIINESVVGVSDEIEGAKVLAIKEDHVILSRAGQRITLRMPVAAIRKERENE